MKKLLFLLLLPCLFSFTERNKQDQDNDRSLREQWVTATNGERFRDHPALELKGDILSYSTRTFSFIATAQQFLDRSEPVISKPTPILIEDYDGAIKILGITKFQRITGKVRQSFHLCQGDNEFYFRALKLMHKKIHPNHTYFFSAIQYTFVSTEGQKDMIYIKEAKPIDK